MRPIYENTESLKNEQEVIDFVCAGNIHPVKLPIEDRVDYALYGDNKKLRGYAEVKCRTNTSDKYPDYLISKNKFDRMQQMSKDSGKNVYLIVRFTDQIMVCNIDRVIERPKDRLAGRRDRDDRLDIEICTFIPMTYFTRVRRQP